MPESTTWTSKVFSCQARSAIYDLADEFSWETVAGELIANLSGDEARDFVETFRRLYGN
jgi:hypothetical protein